MKIEGKSVLFIVLGVGLLVSVAEWGRHRSVEDPEQSDFTNQVKNKTEENERYLETTDENEENVQEDEPDVENEYILVSEDIKTKNISNQAPHVEKYSIIFPSKNKILLTTGKNERQNKINSYKNSLSDTLSVFGMSKMFEGSGDVEPSPTPEGSGETETSPTDGPEFSTTLEGSGDIETSPTPKGSEDTETTPTDVPEISTTFEGTENIDTTVSSVTEMFTTPEAGVDTAPTGLPGTYTTPESSTDKGSGDIEITSTSVTDIFTTVLITETSVSESGTTSQTNTEHVTNDSSTGKTSTALATTVVSEKSSTIQLTSSVDVNATQTPSDLSTPHDTSKESEGTTLTSSLPTEPKSSTILESSKPSTSASLTTIFPRTVEITTRVPATTKITAKPNVPTKQPCQNGGVYDGTKCICLNNFYGPFCEHILDRVGIGPSISTTIKVIIRFIHLIFHDKLKDEKSDEYKKFDTDFKKDMKDVYKNVPGYKDVKILSLSNGSVVVNYDVIIEIEFKSDINVTQQYKDAIKDVEEGLSSIVCDNPDLLISNCISDQYEITETDNLKNEDELCFSEIPTGFQDFYEPKVDGTGLVCVSQCDAMSTKYTNCEDGSCQIANTTGPHCLCSRTDLYIYTSSNCNGKILKSGVYGGVGAAIAVLIIICVAVVFFIRKKKNKKWAPFANDEEQKWYDDKEEDWPVGINNLSENVYNEGQDSSKNSLSSKKEKFTPNLENIDTTFEVKIQRPVVFLS